MQQAGRRTCLRSIRRWNPGGWLAGRCETGTEPSTRRRGLGPSPEGRPGASRWLVSPRGNLDVPLVDEAPRSSWVATLRGRMGVSSTRSPTENGSRSVSPTVGGGRRASFAERQRCSAQPTELRMKTRQRQGGRRSTEVVYSRRHSSRSARQPGSWGEARETGGRRHARWGGAGDYRQRNRYVAAARVALHEARRRMRERC